MSSYFHSGQDLYIYNTIGVEGKDRLVEAFSHKKPQLSLGQTNGITMIMSDKMPTPVN